MQDVCRELMGLDSPPACKIACLSGLPVGGDVVDWLQNHAPDWDGLLPFPDTEQPWALSELRAELKKSEPVPEDSNLAILAGSCSSVFDWEKPNAIETKTPAVDVLRPELMPEPLRPWLVDVSHRMQTPPDFATVSALVIMGSIIGAGCAIRPKRLDDWEVIPNVWGACIGRPSVVLKSPSMKEPMQLLERLQAEYGERFEMEKAAAEFDGLATKAMLDDVKSQLSSKAKGKGKDRAVSPDDLQKLKADYVELTQNAAPEAVRRLFKTNETSIQSMTVLQNQNPRGVLVFRDELTALLTKWDREDGADERAYFLEGWNGNGSYTDCKIGRGITDAKQICISLLGGLQPDKLKRYLYQAMQGNNDGLMQRLQLAVWPDEPESWQLVDTYPNKADKQRVYVILQALAELDFTQCGAMQGEYDDRPYFRFDDVGQAVFNEWLTELQTIKLQQEENPLMVEHFGKFRSLMPSLALIFHCIDIADGKVSGSISAAAARLAVEWCKYLESHARRIYAMAESPEHEAAVRLADKIKAKALPSPFTCKAVYDKGWHGLKDRHEVEAACNVLIDENWLMMERKPVTGNRGRPPLPEYHINPFFL
ncbi:MAG: YfjI family protein [Methylicorpusculum sp.]|uniref:YfjI family protein n=1 Tax=Methylicorpusculum sp. TaxID=2713644 RepID=UPI0027310673|nr:YfjI family protein [Methylicorpusculum sp.]MDP2201770.1 YfjI family protein [Methylicorpusculum sp.]